MAPEGMLIEGAEAGQVCEIHPTPQRKHCLKQLPQKAALPDVDLAVVIFRNMVGTTGADSGCGSIGRGVFA